MSALPLLLTHSYGATRHMWASFADHVRARHPVIDWNLPGHGTAGGPGLPPEAFEREALVRQMKNLLGGQRAVLVGHSLGGYLSLALALAHPECVAGLVLVSTGPGFRKEAARDQWNAFAGQQASDLEEGGLERLRIGRNMPGNDHADAAGLALAARRTLTQKDSVVIDSLGEIMAPTLVVCGSDDRAEFLAGANYLAQKIPESELALIPGAAHAPNIDNPPAFHARVDAFLERMA